MYQSLKHPPRSIGQTGVFTSYSLNLSSPVVDLFMTAPFFTASLYHAGPERGFGWDFACGSPPLSQDWVQVACSQKTWRLNSWRRRHDFNRLTLCASLVWKASCESSSWNHVKHSNCAWNLEDGKTHCKFFPAIRGFHGISLTVKVPHQLHVLCRFSVMKMSTCHLFFKISSFFELVRLIPSAVSPI